MVVPLENPKRVILGEIELLFSLLVIVHKRNARETCRDDTQRQDGSLLSQWSTGRSRQRRVVGISGMGLGNSRSDWNISFQKAAGRHPALP